LAKGLVLLELFAGTERELGITEISHLLSLPKSTVHRIVSTFVAHGYLRQDETNGRYRLALKCWELGCAAVAQLNLVEVARPHLRRLAEVTGENVRLASLVDGEIVYIYAVDGSQVLRPYSRVGQRGPAHGTGTGIALLAYQSPEYIDSLLARGLSPFESGRVMTAEELLHDLAEVRKAGVAVVRHGWHSEVAAVAAPVRDHTGEVVAAGGVSGSLARFTDEAAERFASLTVRSMAAISEELGYRSGSTPSASPCWEPTAGLDGN
jgi:DNA-binding IclR family transcriptional regulator